MDGGFVVTKEEHDKVVEMAKNFSKGVRRIIKEIVDEQEKKINEPE